jgi:hypothetical protein
MALFVPLLGLAIAAAPQAPRRFYSTADAVRVDTPVLDGRRPVGGLTAADFELRDTGVPQQIDDVQIVEVPFSMMLALDTSSSMQVGLPRLREAARAAVAALRPADRGAAGDRRMQAAVTAEGRRSSGRRPGRPAGRRQPPDAAARPERHVADQRHQLPRSRFRRKLPRLTLATYLALRDAAGASADVFAYSFIRDANIVRGAGGREGSSSRR